MYFNIWELPSLGIIKHEICFSVVQQPAAMFKVLNKDPPIPDNLSSEGKDFLRGCFKRNPVERPTAIKLLEHPFIQNSNHFSQNASTHSLAGMKSPVSFRPRVLCAPEFQDFRSRALTLHVNDRMLDTLQEKRSPGRLTLAREGNKQIQLGVYFLHICLCIFMFDLFMEVLHY